jgi:NAD(P)-dependent dehydrogenase (short-subunit alcohol dehydrogenase family)
MAHARRARGWMITGVSSGLGRALARAALAQGDSVVGTARTQAACDAFSSLAPGRATGVLLDLTDPDAIEKAASAAQQLLGTVDILANNAGYGLVGGVEEASSSEIRAQFEANFFGPLALMQAMLPHMRARRRGTIINITSVSGVVGWPSLGIYSASKFALEGVSETLALEVAPLGIKVILVEPGGMRTDFAGRSRAGTARVIDDYAATVGASRRILAEHAGHAPGDPERAAAAIMAIADAPSPPLRILLGSDALGYARDKLGAQQAELEAWSALSRSTDWA